MNKTLDLHALIAQLQRSSLSTAFRIHARLLVSGLHSSPFAISALISVYSNLSLPSLSYSVFLSSPLPHPPSLFVHNSLISALSSNSLPSLALHHFHLLHSHPVLRPDRFSFPCAIRSCADLDVSEHLRAIHAILFKSCLDCDVFISSALIHAYLKFGLVTDAEKAFVELPERDVVLWNAMVTGLAQLGDFPGALESFDRMLREGVPLSRFTVTGVLSVFTATSNLIHGMMIHGFALKVGYDDGNAVCNALIDLYGKCEASADAAKVFDLMPERDIYSWNAMISAHESSGNHAISLRLFALMRRNGVWPDAVSMATALPACSQIAALSHGREIHALMVVMGIAGEAVFVDNALMDMYGKSGSLDDAQRLFDEMPQRDTASWNILIAAHAAHGLAREALKLFERMCEARVEPDAVTFVGVLTACSHAGLVREGKEVMERMKGEFGVEPEMEHYVCAVDMLGRAGRLEEAKEVAERAGEVAAWRAYLWASGEEVGRVEEVVERVVGRDEGGSGGWVLVANAYGRVGRYTEVEKMRGKMKERRVRKMPGCSWVEVAGKGVHEFVTGDRRHPEMERIYEVLQGFGCLG
ncbi:putative tetratricopeptide-like helical domain superfamily [Dioscorea sansibarensis]